MTRTRPRRALALVAALFTVTSAGSLVGRAERDANLRAGVAVADITPDLGRNFSGYVRPEIFSTGVAIRLQARALVLARDEEKLALVSLDLMGVPPGLQRAVAARVAGLGFAQRSVFLAGSHTHAGPDFDINTRSPSAPTADPSAFMSERITTAVRKANDALKPAELAWGRVDVPNANYNRSLEAHLADHGLDLPPHSALPTRDPLGAGHTVDPSLYLLRVDAVDGAGARTPMAAWFRFSAHDTAFPPANDYYSADWSAVAQWRFERALEADGHPGVVAMFANGNEGDMLSLNDSFNPYATADSEAKKIARAMRIAWDAAEPALTREPVLRAREAIVCFCGQNVEGGQVAQVPTFGIPFLGGAENGPSIFYQPLETEGRRRPEELADPVYGRKMIAAPAPFPTTVIVTEIQIANAIIAGIPGEPTTETGRRVRSAMATAGATPENRIDHTVVVGLAQQFTGYFTTPEEYDQQHYEGGATVHGKWSANLLIATHHDLAARMIDGRGDPDPQGDVSAPTLGAAPVLTGDGGIVGAITVQPEQIVPRMRTVTVEWTGGSSGNDRPLDTPFISLERRVGTDWQTVANDLGIGFLWRFENSTYRAAYDVPPDMTPGTYRLTLTSAQYTLPSHDFEVVVSRGLIVRGVTARPTEDRQHVELSFHASMPPPDASASLWDRERIPDAGTLSFRLQPGDDGHVATYDALTRTWIARIPAARAGADVIVPDGGLVDAQGNTSGVGKAYRIGMLDAVEWPPTMPVGGWCVPGVMGKGCFYPDWLYPWPPQQGP